MSKKSSDDGVNSVNLTNVQTASGKLTVTDTTIAIERPAFPKPKTQTVFRSAIVGVDHKVVVKQSLLSKGLVDLIFHVQGGERMQVRASYPIAAAVLAQFGQTLR